MGVKNVIYYTHSVFRGFKTNFGLGIKIRIKITSYFRSTQNIIKIDIIQGYKNWLNI
jgi:hypothetical protein